MLPKVGCRVDHCRGVVRSPLNVGAALRRVIGRANVGAVPVHHKGNDRPAVCNPASGAEMYVHQICSQRFDCPAHPPRGISVFGLESTCRDPAAKARRKSRAVAPVIACLLSVLNQSLADVGAIEKMNDGGVVLRFSHNGNPNIEACRYPARICWTRTVTADIFNTRSNEILK